MFSLYSGKAVMFGCTIESLLETISTNVRDVAVAVRAITLVLGVTLNSVQCTMKITTHVFTQWALSTATATRHHLYFGE